MPYYKCLTYIISLNPHNKPEINSLNLIDKEIKTLKDEVISP